MNKRISFISHRHALIHMFSRPVNNFIINNNRIAINVKFSEILLKGIICNFSENYHPLKNLSVPNLITPTLQYTHYI